ncbi:MAG: minor capsid protein [Ruminococcus bromii]|nr:minor capsid protein [Ruminococcus bromii]
MSDYNIREAFEKIEDELIDSMMRNFSRHRAEETKEGYNWTQWQAEQLKSLEEYRKHNAKKFGKRFKTINSKVEEMIRTAKADGNASQEAEILEAVKDGFKAPKKPSAHSTAEFFKVNDRKLDALIKSTTDDLKRAETAVLRMSNDKYRKAIFNAQVAVNTGAVTYEKAVDMACKDMINAGLNCVEYKNGARHTLSDYADMAVKTANKRAYLRGEGEKRAEWGVSLVVVNSRQGGCSDCAKYIGKVFIDDVYSNGKKSDGNYPLLSTAIKNGLFHPRCKDSTSTYYEEITTLEPVSPEEEAEMDRRERLEEKQQYAQRQAERFDRRAEYSLDKDNKRIAQTRADEWHDRADMLEEKAKKAGNVNKITAESVAKSGKSGIIKEKSKKPITPITDKAISRIPKVDIEGYTEEQCLEIQKQHKELLKFSKEQNEDKEVAFVLKNDVSKMITEPIKGTDEKIDFGSALQGKDLFVMHNHPRNSSYSLNDIIEFIKNDSIKTFTIVKNDGNIEVLTKLKGYDRLSLLTELQRMGKKRIKTGSDSEYRKVIDKFLSKHQEGGLFEWKK